LTRERTGREPSSGSRPYNPGMRLLPLAVLASVAFAQDEDNPPVWKIVPYEAFEVESRPAAENAEALIDGLTKLDKARGGLTTTSGGGIDFSLTDDPFGRLVRLGPAALPAVLAHLDDKRPTKLVFEGWDGPMGGMFRNTELLVPPDRAAEAKAIRGAFPGAMTDWFGLSDGIDFDAGRLKGHTVTVGDCCFAILGQIVNRPYEAVRYQPSVIVAVCSPTLDPRARRSIRASRRPRARRGAAAIRASCWPSRCWTTSTHAAPARTTSRRVRRRGWRSTFPSRADLSSRAA
jgi:hypothetical protein